MLGGVAAGIAEYFDLDPTIVRLLFVLVTIMGGCGIPILGGCSILLIYLVCWLVMPK